MSENKQMACLKCKHYQSSYNARTPRICKFYGFESQVMPYVLVKQSTGEDCQEFSLRVTKSAEGEGEEKETKTNYNDPKYWG